MSPNEFAREMARLAQRYHNEPEDAAAGVSEFLVELYVLAGIQGRGGSLHQD